MRLIRFDSIGGASGDMILASLIGLGADTARLNSSLASLKIGAVRVSTEPAGSHGQHGHRLVIECPHEHHHHRGLKDITGLIEGSDLSRKAKDNACAVFTRLAEAEGKVHGIAPEKVHFHEVGAVDSIIDITGICICLDFLGIDKVTFGPIPTGHGEVKCAHGMMPIPAPATVELMQGFQMRQVDEPFELLTPTAAAVLTTLWTKTSESTVLEVKANANAFGNRTLNSRPNLLRATILESSDNAAGYDHCTVLECNIDDSTPEIIGALSEKLLKNGALDVTLTPIQMKKFRLATMLTVICAPDDSARLAGMILENSSTFGVREYQCKRHILERKHETVKTEYGEVRVKIGLRNGKAITRSPEYDDCLKLSEQQGVPLHSVYQAAIRA